MKNIQIALLVMITLGCKNKSELLTEQATASSLLVISANQFKNLNLELGELSSREMVEELTVNGMIDVPPENVAQVSMAINGKVTQITHNVLPGKYVTKGSVLAMAESMELIQLEQDYLEAHVKNELLSQEMERQKTLVNDNNGVLKKLQEAENAFKLNRALLYSLEAKLRLLQVNVDKLKTGKITQQFPIYAPISGFISNVNVHTGSNFGMQDVLFELMSKAHMHAELKVFEKDAAKIKEGQKVSFEGDLIQGVSTGKIFLIAKNLDESTKTVNVHVHFDDPKAEESLIPGQYIQGKIIIDNHSVLTLPETAIYQESEHHYVFVEKERNQKQVTFEKVEVSIGQRDKDFIQIKSPDQLKKVVLNAFRLSALNAQEE